MGIPFSLISCVILWGLAAGRIGRSYSDRCLEILTGLLGLKQEHITSGKTLPPTLTAFFVCYSEDKRASSSFSQFFNSVYLSLFLSLPHPHTPQRWCRQCVTWSGCVLSVATLCVWLWRAARRRCRIARSDPSWHCSHTQIRPGC